MCNEPITVAWELTERRAMALAQLAKRFSFDDAIRLSNCYDGDRERDEMIAGVISLQSALASSGFAPR